MLYEAEAAHGSIIRGVRKASRSAPSAAPRTLASFQNGNQVLPDTLAASLGSALHLGVPAARILVSPSWAPGNFIIEFRQPRAVTPPIPPIHADHVFLATPAGASAELLEALDPSLASLLAAIEYAPVAVVSLGYPRAAVKHSLDGFGFLAPRSSGLRLLGSVWNSSLFPGRAPEDAVLLTNFVGGAGDPSALKLAPKELQSIVHRELARLLGIADAPVISNLQLWPQAIPQYDLGHHRRAQSLTQKLAAFPGLALAGNYLDGPALGTVVDRARKLADYVLDGPPR
jgi:oxygen-dependent protoporphyrinogen oxidase